MMEHRNEKLDRRSRQTVWIINNSIPAPGTFLGRRRSEKDINAIAKLEDGNHARGVLNERQVSQGAEPMLGDLREALIGVYGTDVGLRGASHISRFTDMARQAARYRDRRVLLAGDAAHVHSPVSGQGLNIGLQDAVNLGWKLAQVVHGTAPESLLGTYHAERHAVGARVLRNTVALTAMYRKDDRIDALREMMCELMQKDAPRKQYVATVPAWTFTTISVTDTRC